MKNSTFKDHFSSNSEGYNNFRPDYPDTLFHYLSAISPRTNSAWDCATGSGQSARKLAHHFKQIIATDASVHQLQNTPKHANIIYALAYADQAPIKKDAIDLITVAQALHWFDMEPFFAEAERVLRKKGILAVWTYNLLSITPELDEIIIVFYRETVGPFWPPERQYVENGYREITFPFTQIAAPDFHMQAQWSFAHLIGYLNTWSAVKCYKERKCQDPLDLVKEDLYRVWGDPNVFREVTWPLSLRVGRKNS